MDRRAIIAWCCYDGAIAAGHVVIDTFIFCVYFSRSVAATPEQGTTAWSHAVAVGGLVVAVLSPVLGAIADRAGPRKPWIAVLTVIAVIAMAVMYAVTPVPSSMTLALVALTVAIISRELAMVFYNAMLPGLAPPGYIGRLSGWGWAAGYVGGLASLVLALYGLVKADPPLFGLIGTAAQENVRAVAPLAAVWLAVFAVPLFLWTPDRRDTGIGLRQAVREGLATLRRTAAEAGKYRDIAWFLVASAVYRDGLATMTGFGGLYAATTYGMGFQEIVLFAMTLNLSAALGALAFAWVDDRVGAKPTIVAALSGLLVFGAAMLLVDDKAAFWWLSLGVGTFAGPSQAAGRSLLARLAPPDMITEMFGLYSLSGKAAAFLGPLVLGVVTAAFNSQRAGMATILVFFLAGLVLMLGVREPAAAVKG